MDIDFSKYSADELYEIARNYQIKKDVKTAIKIYESIIQDFPGSIVADEAKNEIAVIMLTNPPRRPYTVEPVVQGSTTLGGNRFPALRTIAKLFKVLAIVSLLCGWLLAFLSMNNDFFLILIGLVTAMSAFLCWAASEVLLLFLAIEENTRRA